MQESLAHKTARPWDRPLAALLAMDWERWLYVLIAVLALATRLWGLGDRAMSHDESLHVVYSWKLYNGEGYQHDPMMHGPFLFHITALLYFLFGDNDFTGRLAPALFGVALVLLPWGFRRWLGKVGALTASLLLLVSPAISYYSRYIRHDLFAATAAVVIILCVFKYLQEGRNRWLWTLAGATGFIYCTKEVSFMYVATVGLFVVGLAALEWLKDRHWPLRPSRPLDLAVVLGTISLPLLSPSLSHLLRFNPMDLTPPGVTRSLIIFVGFLLVAAGIGMWWDRRRWPIAAGIAYLLMTVLFTTFFTNGKGFATGFWGSLGYWLEQHGVQRGDQPWYYYAYLLPVYEFLPLLFGFGGLVFAAVRGRLGLEHGGKATDAQPMALGLSGRGLFTLFLIWWVVASIGLYSWAG
ncbi:MAG: TIGR03663 family protein, partial [Chloroflexi bacterium]|nr:TIGR03663 family protein [Chloroflexota bacterium]